MNKKSNYACHTPQWRTAKYAWEAVGGGYIQVDYKRND
jgi:hypothetical protein